MGLKRKASSSADVTAPAKKPRKSLTAVQETTSTPAPKEGKSSDGCEEFRRHCSAFGQLVHDVKRQIDEGKVGLFNLLTIEWRLICMIDS